MANVLENKRQGGETDRLEYYGAISNPFSSFIKQEAYRRRNNNYSADSSSLRVTLFCILPFGMNFLPGIYVSSHPGGSVGDLVGLNLNTDHGDDAEDDNDKKDRKCIRTPVSYFPVYFNPHCK